MSGTSRYTPAMTGAATWDIPRVEELREGSNSERRYRERTAAFRALARDVEAHWHDLPSEVRQRLKEFRDQLRVRDANTGRFDLEFKPRTLGEFVGLLALPFTFLRTFITREHYVRDYTMAMAEFIAAVHVRARDEDHAAARAATPDTASWDLPRVEGLRDGSISEHRYRERAAAFRTLARDVETNWYAFPYQVRQRLQEYTVHFDMHFWPRSLGQILGLLALPFTFWRTYVTRENYVSEYTMAMADFIAAVQVQLRDERGAAQRAWDLITRDDPEFVRADDEGVAALGREEFVRVKWTDLKTNIQ